MQKDRVLPSTGFITYSKSKSDIKYAVSMMYV